MSAFLETQDSDFALDAGSLVVVSDGIDIVQTIENRFRFFLGEWFLNKLEGIPYYGKVFVKNPDLGVVRQIFDRVVTTTPGVISLEEFQFVWDPEKRELTYNFRALSALGAIAGGAPFIVP